MSKKGKHNLKWFLDRIGKTVQNTGRVFIQLYIKIADKKHAESLFKLQNLDGNRYTD